MKLVMNCYVLLELCSVYQGKVGCFSIRYLLLVSGLELSKATDHLLPLELMVDYITGHLGCPEEQAEVTSICRVIIAGSEPCIL